MTLAATTCIVTRIAVCAIVCPSCGTRGTLVLTCEDGLLAGGQHERKFEIGCALRRRDHGRELGE